MYYFPTKFHYDFSIDTIYTVHYFEYHKDYFFTGEKHDFWELLYVDKGEVIVSADEKEFVLRQNQLTFHAPNEFHSVRANSTVAPNTIVVSFGCTGTVLKQLAGHIFYINAHERSLLAGIVREAKAAYTNNLSDPTYRQLEKTRPATPGTGAFAAEQMIRCLLEQLLIEFLRSGGYTRRRLPVGSTRVKDAQVRFQRLNHWIDSHIDRSFTMEDLCAESMLNKSTLESLFHQNTGMSAISYCRKRKIEHAKKLLREDVLNISQISERLGFSSVHYFSRTFRQLENISPTEYAKSAKAMIDHASLLHKKR